MHTGAAGIVEWTIPELESSRFMQRSATTIVSSSFLAITLGLTGCAATATGNQAATSSNSAQSSDAGAADGQSTTAASTFFAGDATHEVSIVWDETAYAGMIAAYEKDGSKEWIKADITIDGTQVSDIGVRLKGNSTLRSLSGGAAGGPAGGGGTSSMISSDVPESLPLLIDFDKYVDGQTFEGLTQLSLRPGSPVLNEALALALTEASGQVTQRYAYTTYSVNGSATQTRLLVENPDETYADSLFDSAGVLYKSDAESSFTYRGEDLAKYEEQFKQLNREDTEDLQPIVDFLKWLSEASDEEFDAELANWVDVDSFARYAATMNLLVNGDDMAGPGQNYYLWYDLETKKISIISWDLNLAMTGNATASPDEEVSIGGGGGGGGEGPGGMQAPAANGNAGAPPDMAGPRNADAGTDPAAGADTKGMGGGKGGNALKERFLASAAFQPIYHSAYAALYEQLYDSGTAAALLQEITTTVPTSDNLTAAQLADQAATLKTFIQERTAALKDQI
ncbi:CotH kinase family protein [Paenarthrobacter aurescens]|uniref:CotH kinase family protein n=1 Tax=Paenarthrobacter aurescens TaxID=43663 RepID=UPI0021BFD643|nr:CotH kinase family protein [Paenarthrobacter aurescens]MCT9868269.1 CotH kinase family protein [Paenarthrobacter aurescens]